MNPRILDWTAPRAGQDWRDEDVLRATKWLRSFVPVLEMDRRIECARIFFLRARSNWENGESPLYDTSDAIAWYIFQAEAFANDRQYWVPEEAARIVPFITVIGKELGSLLTVEGLDSRMARTMTNERSQPDSGIFELLVALAYCRRGWRAEFVPEAPGKARTHDFNVFKSRDRWAVECKRLVASTYTREEKRCGDRLAGSVHSLCQELQRSVVAELRYKVELHSIELDYLKRHVETYLNGGPENWSDHVSIGSVREVDWSLPNKVLSSDDVYFGGSRMIELLVGSSYAHGVDHSMAATWEPAPAKPFYAENVSQASVVSWTSDSDGAISRKAAHFRRKLNDAEGQLPADRPGVIHIGIEDAGDKDVSYQRHRKNIEEAQRFQTNASQLRWVYVNHFLPEATTDRNESWALTETTATHIIGGHSVPDPLPNHLLVGRDEDARDGDHWSDSS